MFFASDESGRLHFAGVQTLGGGGGGGGGDMQ